MLDFASRRFTVRLGRSNKSGLVSGEQANKRASVVGRKASVRRRVSARNTGGLRRAPSGLHRGASVRRSQSGVRRGASVRRAPSSSRRNSKRLSAYVDSIPPSSSFQTFDNETGPATSLKPPVLLDQAHIQPTPSSAPPKSFFSKLTSRFRSRSKTPNGQINISTQPSAIAATFSATNLSPVGYAPLRSPSLRSPSPGSRVKFVDTIEESSKVSDTPAENTPAVEPRVDSPLVLEAVKTEPQESDSTSPHQEAVEESDGPEDEWVDAEDDDSEPRISPTASSDGIIASTHAENPTAQPVVPERASTEVEVAEKVVPFTQDANSEETAKDRDLPAVIHLQADILNGLTQESLGIDVRVNEWLAVTPVAEESKARDPAESLEGGEVQIEATLPKIETKKRPPHIVVPSLPSLSSNNPFRVPLPPSPSPSNVASTLAENNPFKSLIAADSSLAADSLSPEGLVPPPSPSILLTPAAQDDVFDLEPPRDSDELLVVDSTQVPLPPSPGPLRVTIPQSQDSLESSPSDGPRATRAGSVSTSGGRRSLSTAPSTRGPTTPTSARIPGHPALAHFSFGGPRSPGLKIEDWEDGEEERRGRSLEVASSKRRMRSTSPGLDAVLEGDEGRRNPETSIDEVKLEPELKQPLSPLPVVEEVTTFGSPKRGDDTDGDHEDETDGFFAFAEQQMEKERKVAETRQLDVPKRSKTMSFLGVGFGKRKSTMGDPRPMSPPAVTSPGGLLGLPTSGPKRSSTLLPESSSNRISRLMPAQRSSTMMTLAVEPRVALSPTMYTVGDIHTETGKIEDDESRRLSEAVFMF